MKIRLDKAVFERGLVSSRSQAESYIRLGRVKVNAEAVKKTGFMVDADDEIVLDESVTYVSRAGHKLASISGDFNLDFRDKVVLDVGSSTGGFTDYSLKNGAKKVIAVDVGTNQLHPSLRSDSRIELHEQTDIRNVFELTPKPDLVVIDVSFISLRDILPHIKKITGKKTQIVAMVKPQFEADKSGLKHKGVIKNESMRREILKDFETWCKDIFFIKAKLDSKVSGEKGNTERFYILISL